MSGDFQDEIGFLGIQSSPYFVRQPEGNGVAERFIRTLKENFLWVHTFDTVEELRLELRNFVAHSNATWLVARPRYPWLPEQRSQLSHQPGVLHRVASTACRLG